MPQIGAIRVNISVPKELKTRMEASPEQVNWSKVACQAFEAKLLELESKKEVKGIKDVIARWKAADELDRNEDYRAGRAASERWAKEDARPKQLRALAKLVHGPQLNRTNFLGAFAIEKGETNRKAPLFGKGPGFGWALAQAIAGKLEYLFHVGDLGPHSGLGGMLNDMDIALFWTKVLGENWKFLIEDRNFAQGFLEGALDIWEIASRKL
jgi:hypothetical protein